VRKSCKIKPESSRSLERFELPSSISQAYSTSKFVPRCRSNTLGSSLALLLFCEGARQNTMGPFCFQFANPLLYQLSSISTFNFHQLFFYLRMAFLQLLKISAFCKAVALAAVGYALFKRTDPNSARWRSAAFLTPWTQGHGLYGGEPLHEFFEVKCFGRPLF